MLELVRHPGSAAPDLTIKARASRSGAALELRYRVSGEVSAVKLPARAQAMRIDELWRHTCLEAFVQPVGGAGYVELNLAPSTAWASYRFDGYREGMRDADLTPAIEISHADGRLELSATVELPELAQADWRVGLAAVIEDVGAARSYWALQHPPGKPDFHNADCFVLELPGSRGA